MPTGLYLRGVMDILGLSESSINKLVNEGHLTYVKNGSRKRVFCKSDVQEFKKNSPVYKTLTKQKVIVYLSCDTQAQEREFRRKAKQYCLENNYKANIISRQDSYNNGYKIAINYIFDMTGITGLIYFGFTDDVEKLKKIFQSNENAFVLNINEIEKDKNI